MKTEYKEPPLPLCLQWKDAWQAAVAAEMSGLSDTELRAYYERLNREFLQRQEEFQSAHESELQVKKA